tara:strand:+ start:21489 stop:21854 length:366 start_codon:yes stop_codon:yes gene_type:complete
MPVSTETYTPGDSYLGSYPLATRRVTIVSGAGVLARNTVIGQITSGGKYKTALGASSDGSEDPRLILAEDVDASSGDVSALAYASGDFDASKLIFGAGVTAADFEAACDAADRPIFIKSLA